MRQVWIPERGGSVSRSDYAAVMLFLAEIKEFYEADQFDAMKKNDSEGDKYFEVRVKAIEELMTTATTMLVNSKEVQT